MDLGEISKEFIWGIFIVFARIGTLFTVLPGISENFVAIRARLFLALTISLVITPIVSKYLPILPNENINIIIIIIQEVLVGIFFGSIVRILLGAASIGGNIISLQSSLSSATMFDPTQNTQNPIISNFYTISSMALLFILDIHHIILTGLIRSFEIINFAEPISDNYVTELITKSVSESFIIGLKISSPYILVGFLVNVISACIARLIPSISIFFIITPLQIWLSLVTLYITFLSCIEWYLGEIAKMNFLL